MKKLITSILALTMTISAIGVSPAMVYADSSAATSESEQAAGLFDISKAVIAKIPSKVYTGKNIKPKVTVYYDNSIDERDGFIETFNGKTYLELTKGVDYTVTYKNNKKVGKATVTIKGKGLYTGTATKTFKIIPKKSAVTKAYSPKKGRLKLTLKKVSGVTGYEITYATNRKVTKNKKVIYTKKLTKTIKGLKKGQTYYFKVRAYKTIDGKKYFSKYSKIKPAKVIAYTNKSLNKAIAALIKGNSTKKQRELIRQYEINYVSKTYPDKVLDEKLYAYTDKNGKRTDNQTKSKYYGNSEFEGGSSHEQETTYYYWGTDTLNNATNYFKIRIKEHVDSNVCGFNFKNYNIVACLWEKPAQSLQTSLRMDLPLYIYIFCRTEDDGINDSLIVNDTDNYNAHYNHILKGDK